MVLIMMSIKKSVIFNSFFCFSLLVFHFPILLLLLLLFFYFCVFMSFKRVYIWLKFKKRTAKDVLFLEEKATCGFSN